MCVWVFADKCVSVRVCETASHIKTTAPNSAHLFSSDKFYLTLPRQSMMFSEAFGGAICDGAWHGFLRYSHDSSSEASDVRQAQPHTPREEGRAEEMSADLIWLRDKFPPGEKKQRAACQSVSRPVAALQRLWRDAVCQQNVQKSFLETGL